MTEVTIIGVDIAKNVFHLHGAASDGSVVFREKLTRTQFQRFMASQPTCCGFRKNRTAFSLSPGRPFQ